jgi:hypothetical protein
VKVTDNHFSSDFLPLDDESTSFEISAELSFQDRKSIFHELSSGINNIIEMTSHFLAVSTSDYVIIPGANRDNRIGMKIFSDQSMD